MGSHAVLFDLVDAGQRAKVKSQGKSTKAKVLGIGTRVKGMTYQKSVGAALIVAMTFVAAPAYAQIDLTGTWQRVGQNDNGASREPVDLLGMRWTLVGRAPEARSQRESARPKLESGEEDSTARSSTQKTCVARQSTGSVARAGNP